jgi:LAS superfamily LD-carboxypeptidase LdcB
MPYPNGRLPDRALFVVQGKRNDPSVRLANFATARDYKRMVKDAAKAGVALTIVRYGDYRDFHFQGLLKGHPAQYGSTLKPAEIAPAGQSSHGQGSNLDVFARSTRPGLTDAQAWQWVLAHLHRYRFHQRDAIRDPHCLAHS